MNAATSLPHLMTVEEVAEFLRTSKKAVYAMLERGQLPGVVRFGRRVLFRRLDLQRHVGLDVLRTSQPNSSSPKAG